MNSSDPSTAPAYSFRINWIVTAQIILLLGALGALFFASLEPLFSRWIKWDQDLAHALPTIGLFLFLIARTKSIPYTQNSPATQRLLLVLLGVLSLIWCLVAKVNIAALANLIIFACIPLLISASFSVKTAYFLAAPVGILFFTLPIFSQFNNYLVDISAFVVGHLVHFIGITALIDGQSIYLSSGHIIIAGGCSGLRYLTIALLMSYLLSILNNYSLKRSVITIAIGLLLGLATNWLRIFFLVLIGDFTAMQSSLMHDHELFGWVLFACILFPSIYLAPILPDKQHNYGNNFRFKPVIPLLALTVGPIFLMITDMKMSPAPQLGLHLLQAQAINAEEQSRLTLTFPENASTERLSIERDNLKLHIQFSQYTQQDKHEKLVPYFESLYNIEEWRKVNTLELAAQEQAGFKALVLKRNNSFEYQLLVYRYEVGQYNTAHYEMAKLLQIPAALTHHSYFNILAITAPCDDEFCANALQQIEKIAADWENKTQPLR